jgi:hypothetical protein
MVKKIKNLPLLAKIGLATPLVIIQLWCVFAGLTAALYVFLGD